MRKISYKSSLVAVHHWLNNNGNLCWRRFLCGTVTVWPDWAIYCTLGNFSKAVAAIILTKLPMFYAIFVEVSKSFIFLWNHFWATFIDIWQLFTGHTDCNWNTSQDYLSICLADFCHHHLNNGQCSAGCIVSSSHWFVCSITLMGH